jgi:DeoR family suf operon transcriptional repressor
MARCGLDLVSPTKRELLMGIKRRGRALAEELAAETFLSGGAARQHLRTMEMQGYLAHDVDRTGTGRPRHIFRLTALGESLFPNASSDFLRALLTSIEESSADVRAGVLAGAVEVGKRSLPRVPADASTQVKVQALGGTLDRIGFLPEIEELPGGRMRLILGHCPASELAPDHPILCEIEQAVVRQALAPAEVKVVEQRTRGGETCRYEITSPESSA